MIMHCFGTASLYANIILWFIYTSQLIFMTQGIYDPSIQYARYLKRKDEREGGWHSHVH